MGKVEHRALDREARRYRRLYRGMIGVCAVLIVIGVVQTFDKAAARRDLDKAEQQHDEQAEAARVQVTNLWAANAQLLGSLIWERRQAGTYEAKSIRTGRQNLDLKEDVERLKNNWTSELGIEQ